MARADKGRLRREKKLLRLLADRLYRRALRHRVAAAIEHRDVPFGQHYRTVIDVGAHHGQFALFARHRFPKARLLSFEPLAEAVRMLECTQKLVGNMSVIAAAVAARDGEAEFVVSRATDSSSLRQILPSYVDAFPGTDAVARAVVRTVALDSALGSDRLERPCLLKIDVQGGELDVLQGAERVLGTVDAVLVECSFVEFYAGQPLMAEVVTFLHERRFVLTDMSSIVRDRRGLCLQADLLFERSSR